MSLVVRGLAVWFLILLGATANGAVRQAWLVPWLGDAWGHVVSTVLLSLLIFAFGWMLSGWLDVVSAAESWLVGGVWLVLTVAFEVLAGHFLFGAPWSQLLADYDLARGRVWVLVLLTTLLTPRLLFWLKR
jgi:hypothetical protein